MKANDIITTAINMLNYGKSEVNNNSLTFLNNVYAEIHFIENGQNKEFKPLKTINYEVNLSNFSLYNCIVYGLCASLALSENDIDNQNYYSNIYNNRLRMVPKLSNIRTDVVSSIEGANV